MTRNQKLSKLGNAIREYRGVFCTTTKKWRHAPNNGKWRSIAIWLERLGIEDIPDSLTAIDGFKSFDEMHAWMSKTFAVKTA